MLSAKDGETDLEPPADLRPLWQAFLRLAARRQIGTAANPLTFTELEAFCRLTRQEFSAWQVDLLMRLDDLALRIANERAGKVRPKAAEDQPGHRGMHPLKAMLIERAAKTSQKTSPGDAK